MVNLRYLPKHLIFSRWMDILPLIAEDQSTSSGWWYTYPSEKYESQLGWWHSQYIIPNWMESHKNPWFQTANQQSWPRFWEPSCPKYQGPRLRVRRAGPLWVWPRSCTIFRTYTWNGGSWWWNSKFAWANHVQSQFPLGKSHFLSVKSTISAI